MKKTLLMIPLSLVGLMALGAEEDSLKVGLLQEVSVVPTVKEKGEARQQPTSASLLNSRQLSDQHATSLKGAMPMVPNVFIPDYGSRLTSAIYIRGIGSRINTPAVGLYVDNIPYVDKSAFDFNFYDIERVDVLRGPQGTLYGSNTMGGLIRVYTRNPMNYEGTDAKLSYSTGDNHRQASLTHYHRVSEKMAFSGGGYYEGSDGFFRHHTTGNKVDDMQAGGIKMRGIYQPTNTLSFDMSLGYDISDEGAYPYFYTGAITPAGELDGEEQWRDRITANRESSYRRQMLNTGLNIEYQAKTWKMNAITGFQHLHDRMFMDQDFLQPDIYTLEQRQRINTLTEEVTFKNTRKGRWDWLSGISLMQQWLHTEAPVTFYGDGLNWLEGIINRTLPQISSIPMLQGMGFTGMNVNFRGTNMLLDGSYNTPTTSLAIFHQSTMHVTNRWDASLGLRLGYERQQLCYNAPAEVPYGFRMPNAGNPMMNIDLQQLQADLLYEGTLCHHRFSALPKASVLYKLGQNEAGHFNGNLYASFSMGQRSGGYNLQMFGDLLQGALRANMMQGIKTGIGQYMQQLVDKNPAMPAFLPGYVTNIMEQNMPNTPIPTVEQTVYKPEYSINYEVGTHLTFPEQHLTLDASAFYSTIHDQQIARFVPSGLGRMMVNAGKSQSLGAELAVQWSPCAHLSLTGNYGFTHATFLEYDDGEDVDYKGNHVPFVPTHTIFAEAAYSWTLHTNQRWWQPHRITLATNTQGAGRIWWTESNMISTSLSLQDNDASQAFYALLGARLSMQTQHFTLTIWGKNLTDKAYNTFYFQSASRGFEQHGKPLHIGIDLNMHF